MTRSGTPASHRFYDDAVVARKNQGCRYALVIKAAVIYISDIYQMG